MVKTLSLSFFGIKPSLRSSVLILKYGGIAHRACNKTILPKYAIRVYIVVKFKVYLAVYLQTQMENNARHDQLTAF